MPQQEHVRAKLVAIGSGLEQKVVADLLGKEGSKWDDNI